MTRYLIITILTVFFGMPAVYAQVANVEQTRTDFEKLAAVMPYLCLSSVLYDRPDHYSFQAADPKKTEEHFQILAKVTDGTYSMAALIGLLTHDDAKVRTLAAVALFDREDPSVLPSLVKLCDDESATFDGHPELSPTWLRVTGIGPPAKKQTVRDIAKMMVSFYMEHSGFHYGIAHKTQLGFTEYWNARSNRNHCAAWFAVQLARASQGISQTQKDCVHRIRLLREQIDKLSPDESSWVFLWLNGEAGSDALVTEKELIQVCRTLGPDKLLLMLQKKIPSDDPDLQSRTNNNWPYQRMQLFVLSHAEQLLRRGDGNTLLACERWERDFQKYGITDPTISPWWAVAAARLEPANASQILHEAMKRFQDEFDSYKRATLSVAMWELRGKAEMKFIVDWLFVEQPQRGSFPNCRGQFIEAMRGQINGREVIAEIIKDNRLNDLDWQSLERLVRAVNAWAKTPIVPEAEIRKVWHPLGQGHYHWEKDKATRDYPKETEELQVHLSDWRMKLRMSIQELLDGNAGRGNVDQKTPTDAEKPRR